jgi:hypothetical protein
MTTTETNTMTNDQLKHVLFYDIMGDAALNDIAPLTTVLMKSLNNLQVHNVRRWMKSSIAARAEEIEDGFNDEPEFPARLDAVFTGVRDFLTA